MQERPCTPLPRCPQATSPLRPGDVVRIRDERWRIVSHAPLRAMRRSSRPPAATPRIEPLPRTLSSSVRADRSPAFVARAARRPPGPMASRRPARACGRDALLDLPSDRCARRTSTLIPFQLEPALALVRGHGCRFLLADGVGLGKTVQAGLMIAEVLARRPERACPGRLARRRFAISGGTSCSTRFRLDADVLDAAGIAGIAADLPPAINPWSLAADRRHVDRLHQAAGGDAIDRDADLGLRRLRRGAQSCRPIGSRRRGAGRRATLACGCAPHGDASFRRRGGVSEAVRHRRHAVMPIHC